MLRVFVARTADEIERLRERWEHCATESVTIFQHFLWVNLAAIMFAAVESPLIVVAESDSGLALIPGAVICGGAALGMVGGGVFDFRDVVQGGEVAGVGGAGGGLGASGFKVKFSA